jgi:hypothetical protein
LLDIDIIRHQAISSVSCKDFGFGFCSDCVTRCVDFANDCVIGCENLTLIDCNVQTKLQL